MKPIKNIDILVVEDDTTMRNVVMRILREEAGIEVIEWAENGLVGWRKLQGKPYDLVLVDWVMPLMDGYNFIKTVRQSPKRYNTKIIMTTSKNRMEDIADALQAGVTSYIIKPYKKDSLIGKLELVHGTQKISPKETECLDMARKCLDDGDYDGALAHFSKALDVVPANPFTRYMLVETYMKKLEYGKAYQVLSDMLKCDLPHKLLKSSGSVMVELGDDDYEKGRLSDSAVKYNEAITADPKQAEAHIGLAAVETKMGNNEAASKHMQRADQLMLDIGVDDIKMLNNIAIRYRRSGNPRKAINTLTASMHLVRENAFLLYNLGRAYIDVDDFHNAGECFKNALKLEPGFKEAQIMLDVLLGKSTTMPD